MEKQPQNHILTILFIVGGTLLLAGVIFAVVGAIDLYSAIRAQASPHKLWCLLLAFPFLGIGGGFFTFALKSNNNEKTKE